MLKTTEHLENKIALLTSKLEEANGTIDAIRTGQVDALVVRDQNSHELFTLKILADLTAQKEMARQLKMKNGELKEAHKITAKLNNELEDKVRARTKELLISNENFKFLADHIPVIVWTSLTNGEINYYNQKWYEYTGKTFEETKASGWQSVIHPDDFDYTLTAWNRSIKSGASYKGNFRIKRASDGAYRWHLANASPIKNNEGVIIAWFGICTDIQDYMKELEKKDEFITLVSHELKTPVTILKTYTQIMLMNFEKEKNSEAIEHLLKMDNQIGKLTILISDLLDASKVNAGKLNFNIEKFDFNELIKEIVDEMQQSAKTHQIETNPVNLELISGDRNRIGQVITNLISNAIKYSPNNDKVLISTQLNNNEVKFIIQDFGIGMPASQQSKLFTRFFRVDDYESNNFPGLGLGLYISNEIIKRHGGYMNFTSIEGKGSLFFFTLPL